MAIRMNLVTMSQTTSPSLPTPSLIKFTSNIIEKEGIGALYKGLSAGIVRQIFYATSRLGIFEILRDKVAQYWKIDFKIRVVLGAIAGACSAVISCPAEVTLVRMANDNALPVAERRGYKNVVNAAYRIATEEGIMTYWRGCSPFVQRVILVGICQIATYDQFKDMYKAMKVPDGFPNAFCSSMSSGFILSIVTNPLETVKNRMAFQKKDASGNLRYTSTYQTLRSVVSEEGIRALWKGFLPYYSRCGGHTVAMFVAVEQMRTAYFKFKKQTN